MIKNMKVAFQINKIEQLKEKSDSSLLIMKECLKRGFEVWFYYPEELTYQEEQIFTKGFLFNGKKEENSTYSQIKLDDFNFIFVRQDPPFDMNYITATYLLEKLKKAKVLNNPASIRNCPEKLFVLDFAKYMPKTIITNSKEQIQAFWQEQGEIILKPLYAHGGQGVFYIPKNDKNLSNAINILKTAYYGLPIIAQEYLPNVTKGDKRILFVNGEYVGCFDRKQSEHSAVSNTASGGTLEISSLTQKNKELCDVLKPKFKELGLFLVGIDVIDDLVTEINVTSPTGYVFLNQLYQSKVEEKIVDEMLKL